MKKTSLYSRHVDLGAKIVPFAGYLMPVQYQGINLEHEAVRKNAGLFDVSHMGEFIVEGPQAEVFLQNVTINDVSIIKPGQAQYSAMCNDDGGIIDDLLIYRYEEYFMLVVNAANIESDFQWLKKNLIVGVVLNDISEKIGLVALQGPDSKEILAKIFKNEFKDIPYYHFIETKIANLDVSLARTGYTGELGYEMYADSDDIGTIWDLIMEAGSDFNIVPAGLGCRDTLRLEMKYCLYGNDIGLDTNPAEAGLGWITRIDKGDFIGKKAIVDAKANISRRLVCIEMLDRAIPRKGYSVKIGDALVGVVTSGTQSPSLKKGIGLAFIDIPYHKSGTEIFIEIRGSMKKALIVKQPFYKNGTVMI